MKRSRRGSWGGLYALGIVTAGLLYASARLGGSVHKILPLAIIVIVGSLAWLWSEKHADLVAAEGANARAEEDALATAGVPRGRFAPSLTARQANYRDVMLAQAAHRSRRNS